MGPSQPVGAAVGLAARRVDRPLLIKFRRIDP